MEIFYEFFIKAPTQIATHANPNLTYEMKDQAFQLFSVRGRNLSFLIKLLKP